MHEETTERHSQVGAIKKEARSDNGGRSYLLQGLWACRLSAGLSQKELAKKIRGSQGTIRKLERGYRGAYPKTIQRLCTALEVTPKDLLCGGNDR